jgi:hypothetical protein
MTKKPLPQIHLVKDTDLTVLAYELHIFPGDFLRECEFNMRSLITNTGNDSIAIMGKNHMWLTDALFAYQSTADLHQMLFTTEYIGARVFLFHTDKTENGHRFGDLLMMDLDTLRQDVKKHTLYPTCVQTEVKDGRRNSVCLEKWHAMEPYEKQALKSWGFTYEPEQVSQWQEHYSDKFRYWKENAFSYAAQDLEEKLNYQYMESAQYPDMDKYRIPMETAKQILLHAEAPVYRLFPHGAEKIPPITAVTTGLWFQHYRAFAVAPEDLGALDKVVAREVARLTGNRPVQRTTPEHRSDHER